jgi:hypothetical protein
MSETKYGKYIITELKPKIHAPWEPKFTRDELIPVLYLDNSVVEGAFYIDTGRCRHLLRNPVVRRINMIMMRFSLFSVLIPRTPMIYMPKRKYTSETKYIP